MHTTQVTPSVKRERERERERLCETVKEVEFSPSAVSKKLIPASSAAATTASSASVVISCRDTEEEETKRKGKGEMERSMRSDEFLGLFPLPSLAHLCAIKSAGSVTKLPRAETYPRDL
jgi:hypothetical protein